MLRWNLAVGFKILFTHEYVLEMWYLVQNKLFYGR